LINISCIYIYIYIYILIRTDLRLTLLGTWDMFLCCWCKSASLRSSMDDNVGGAMTASRLLVLLMVTVHDRMNSRSRSRNRSSRYSLFSLRSSWKCDFCQFLVTHSDFGAIHYCTVRDGNYIYLFSLFEKKDRLLFYEAFFYAWTFPSIYNECKKAILNYLALSFTAKHIDFVVRIARHKKGQINEW
jgi:hypothetical protein